MVSAAVMATKKQGLGLHVNVGGIVGEGGDLVGEEDGRGVEVLAHAVPDNPTKLLYLLSHFSWVLLLSSFFARA